MRDYASEMPWVLVELDHQRYALPSSVVREIVALPEIATIPRSPDYVRGVINLRGRALPVIDLRKRLGMKSSLEETDEFCALLEARERDHRRWLEELDASVRERRKFTLALDPHQCAFGKWYDHYVTDDPWRRKLLHQFDAPHRAVHALGAQVEEMKAREAHVEALALINEARIDVLAKLIRLFEDLRFEIRRSSREVAVVIGEELGTFTVTADAALSVETLDPGSIEMLTLEAWNGTSIVRRIGKRGGGDVFMLVETEHVLERGGRARF